MVFSPRLLASGLCLAWLGAVAQAGGVPRAECFPVETLPPAQRAEAERVLLNALDNEALYTFVGGLKPVSEGFTTLRWEAGAETGAAAVAGVGAGVGRRPDPAAKLDDTRRMLRALRCGENIYSDVLVFKSPAGASRVAHAYVANAAALRAKIAERPGFWVGMGVTPWSHPATVQPAIDAADPSDRFRGFGYVFGYPDHAVDFFVAASESEKATGAFVKRDFVQVPTFSAARGRFVWAVPKGQGETAADKAVRDAAAPVLEAYRQRRAYYVGDGRPGVVALLRDWYDDGTGHCDPANARVGPFIAPTVVGPCCPAVPVRIGR